MPTASSSFTKDSALASNSVLLLQPDPDSRTASSPTDMSTCSSNRQSTSRELGQIAEGSSPETRNTKASSMGRAPGQPVEHFAAPMLPSNGQSSSSTHIPIQYTEKMDERQDEEASKFSPDNQPCGFGATQAPMSSRPNSAPQDEWKDLVAIQRQILEVLTKMSKNMDGQKEEDNNQSTGLGAGAQSHKEPFKRTNFGIPKQRLDQGQQFNPVNEDYEQIFPEDPYGEETGPNARVFRVYNEEADVYDADMVGQCSDSSDVLLVFAGLFSAVLTTFVAQTSQALETDIGAISNSLLSEVVQLLRAQENGTSFGQVSPAITETTPTANDLWVNGLWFTSLTLSLATALFAVLTKQWLRQYMVKTSGTIRDRSLIRQFRFAGMKKWHVVAIIGTLPILLHLALCIFLAGLVVFLVPRSRPLAWIVCVITSIVYCLYLMSNLCPAFDIQCPYRTPLSNFFNSKISISYTSGSGGLDFMSSLFQRILPSIPIPTLYLQCTFRWLSKSLGIQEHGQIQRQSASLSLNVIEWLMDASSNPSVHAIAIEAIGGLPPSQRKKVKINLPHRNFVRDLIEKCLTSGPAPTCRPGCAGKLERLSRAFPVLRVSGDRDIPWDIYSIFRDSGDIQMKASALGLGLNEGKDRAIAFNHLLDSPDINLSPCAWINLLENSHSVQSTCRFKICKRALEHWDTSLSDQSIHVPMSDVLTRGSAEVVLSAFRDHDPLKNMDWSLSLPMLLQGSLSRQLLSFRALFAMFHFLQSKHTSIDSLSLPSSVWVHAHNELERDPIAHDCAVVVLTGCQQWLESPPLKGNGWMASERKSHYCHTILDSYGDALFYAPYALQDFQWNFAERVAEITFPTGDVSSKVYITSTRGMAGRLWCRALEENIESAFTTFVEFHVLGHDPSAFTHFPLLVPGFISGLLRQVRSPPYHDSFLACLSYLHEPDNILMACKILAQHLTELDMENNIVMLAQIDPDNEAWDGCREKLRQWCQDIGDTGLAVSSKHCLDTLDKFFERRRRHNELLKRASLRSLVPGRRGSVLTVPPSPDVERGQISPSRLSASHGQRITNPVVVGETITEIPGEGGENGHGEDLEMGSQPPMIGGQLEGP